jgi:hypothetical protein
MTTIADVEEFFKTDDKPYRPLSDHALEQSPCRDVIAVRIAGKRILYYCEICHPQFGNMDVVASIFLDAIEHHCLFKEPEKHKAAILARLVKPVSPVRSK